MKFGHEIDSQVLSVSRIWAKIVPYYSSHQTRFQRNSRDRQLPEMLLQVSLKSRKISPMKTETMLVDAVF